ncbi:MAG: hypothetical protein OHK0046_07210 [Anaerolineae bacterium]
MTQPENQLNSNTLFGGFIVGISLGALVALLRGPRLRLRETGQQITSLTESVRHSLESAVPTDPIDESIAEGKAAARRRRSELGAGR